MVVMVVQQCECTSCQRTVHLKMVKIVRANELSGYGATSFFILQNALLG